MRFSLLFLSMIAFSCMSFAQSFSSDPVKFLDQLERHLGSYDKRVAKEFVEEFTPVFTGLKTSEQSKVIEMCNLIDSKALRVYPDFTGYIYSVNHIYKKNMGAQVFSQWNDVLGKVLAQKQKKKWADFLEMSGVFFEKGYFFDSKRLSWGVRGGSFSFTYDKVPIITFNDITLTCYSNNDSSVIYNTSGTYLPQTTDFKGKGGKMLWTRTGLEADETYGEFTSKYDLNIKSSAFKLDSVSLHTPYFKEPLLGKIDEKVLMLTSSSNPSYPRFQSYSKRLTIKEIKPEVDYEGGFTMHGATFIGTGTPAQPAILTFYRKGSPFIQTTSLTYNIAPEKISSPTATLKVFLDKDSIYHPGLRLEYVKSEKTKDGKITLIRTKEGVGQSPFNNTYHAIDMQVESISWGRGDSTLYMGPLFGSSKTNGLFESQALYDRRKFERIGGNDNQHPMIAIANHATRYDQFEFKTAELSTALGATINTLLPLYYELNNNGFILYDKNNEKIYIKQKLFDYIDNYYGRKDYDNISIYSDPNGGANAIMNVATFDLKIDGVSKFNLSDRQFVQVFPKATKSFTDPNTGKKIPYGEIKMFKNRNILFDGTMIAGSTDYFGTNFNFDYEDFTVEIPQCDSMKIWVWPFQQSKNQIPLRSVIEDIKGEIKIDHPTNKASLDTSFNDYPILTCTKETYVFYDKISKGAYPRTTFYYKIKPFELDSLDNFNRDALRFDGTLVSAGIFPDFDEPLRVLTDYSLGFVRQAPKEGFDLYKDKGLFQNTIALTGDGLVGDGIIEFVKSTSVSKAFIFYPDSTVGVVDSFVNEPQGKPVEFPHVVGYGVKVAFNPEANRLDARSVDKNLLNFFDDQAVMKGAITVTEQEMTGRGKMSFGNADLFARKFTYKEHKIQSDTAEFDLASLEEQEGENLLAFKTHNVSALVDFKERQGVFKSNGKESHLEFPENQYICFMDEFKWHMDNDDIELQKKSDIVVESTEFEKPNFYSIHPKQDSLSFMAPKARYDLKKKIITCTEVPFMDIADARIVPDSGVVIVRKKAKIETLENAVIIADNVSKNHKIVNVTCDVLAKRSYKASGDYFYIDEDKNEFKIHFADIQPDSAYTTYAEGKIAQEENFRLSKNFEFYGDVELYALNKSLVFDGATRITHPCEAIPKNWMSFKSEIDPLDIYIPVGENLTDLEGKPIGAGMIMNPSVDSLGIYSTFLSNKGSATHPTVIAASGFLHFDKGSNEYRISNMEKLQEQSLPGNYVSLQTENCILKGDGTITFGVDLGQVDATSIGVISHNINSKEVSLKGAMIINFPFSDKAMDIMVEGIKKTEGLIPVELGKTFYKKSLLERLDKELAEEIQSEITLKGSIKGGKFPKELLKSLYIADITMKWNDEMSAYVSEGLIGIANVNKNQMYTYVNGRVVIEKRTPDSKGRSKDRIYVYLEADPAKWYYFEYSNDAREGRMEVISSNNDFMNEILETKEDKTKYKGEKGKPDYSYFAGKSKSKRMSFLSRFE